MAGVLTSFRELDASSWGDFEAFFGAYHGARMGTIHVLMHRP